jgi:hypothetical protein
MSLGQSIALTGAGTGIVPGSVIDVTDDVVVTASMTDSHGNFTPEGWGNVSSLVVNWTSGAAGTLTGARTPLLGNAFVTHPSSPSNLAQFYAGAILTANIYTDDNGIAGQPRGSAFGLATVTYVKSAVKHWGDAFGAEFDVVVEAGASVQRKYGVYASLFQGDGAQGVIDGAYVFDAAPTTPGWRNGLHAVYRSGSNPFSADGSFISTNGPVTMANVVDVSSATVTGYLFKSGPLTITGQGAYSVTTGALTGDVPAMALLSGSATQHIYSTLGRTLNTDLVFGVAGLADDFMTGTVSGDAIITYAGSLKLGHLAGAPHVTISSAGAIAVNALTATSINKVAITQPATGSTLTIADSKTFTVNSTLTFSGTDGTSFTLPAGSATLVGVASTAIFTGKTYDTAGAGNVLKINGTQVSTITGTGAVVLAAAPALTGVPTAPTAAANNNTTQIATTAYLDTKLGAASGIATLDGGGKLTTAQIPASLVGAVQYQGTWNASTNSPALVSSTGAKGQYYKVSVAGATTIDTISQWNVGDTIIFDGTTWDKIDGLSSEVITVAGRFGAVVLAVADVSGAAPLASPTFTGVPAAPTAAVDTNTTQLATTAMVLAQAAAATPLIDGAAAIGTSTRFARGDHVHPTDTTRAPLASPTFTGTPAAPTAAVDTNTTQLATTAMVLGQASAVAPPINGVAAVGTSTRFARADHVHALGIQKHLAGLTLSAAGATATFGIAAGVASDSTDVSLMTLAGAFTKTTGAWVVGTANGSFDGTGSAPSATAGWYHVYLIKRPDTGVVDVLTSNSATAPTLPANYTLFRRIGSMLTNGSFQWVKFFQDGDNFTWDIPVIDFNAVLISVTTAILRTISTPLGINVVAIFHSRGATGTAATAIATIFTDPAQTDNGVPDFTTAQHIANTTLSPYAQLRIRTNTSSQIRTRSNFSDANTAFTLVTEGWVDTRGK